MRCATSLLLAILASACNLGSGPPNAHQLGTSIQADLDGDGTLESLTIKKRQLKPAPPDHRGVAYRLNVTGSVNTSLDLDCCQPLLLQEGDLLHNGREAVSLIQEPLHGCIYGFTTYALATKSDSLLPLFSTVIPTGCDPMDTTALFTRISRKNGQIIVRENDPNTEDFGLVERVLAPDPGC